jgi:hypothetical protein
MSTGRVKENGLPDSWGYPADGSTGNPKGSIRLNRIFSGHLQFSYQVKKRPRLELTVYYIYQNLQRSLMGKEKDWLKKAQRTGLIFPYCSGNIKNSICLPKARDWSRVPNPFAVDLWGRRVVLEQNSPHRTEFDAEGPFFLRTKVTGGQDLRMNGSFSIKGYVDTGFLGEERPGMVERTGQGATIASDALLGIYFDGHLFIFERRPFFHHGIAIPSSASLAETSCRPRAERVFFIGHPLSRSQP